MSVLGTALSFARAAALGGALVITSAGCARIPLKGGDVYILPGPLLMVLPPLRATCPDTPGPGEPCYQAPQP